MVINFDAAQRLLERDRELELADAAIARTVARTGGVLLIEGPPGVGKSKLMAAIRTTARKSALTVLEARGAALEREFAFGVVRQLFERVAMPGRVENPEALFDGAASMAAVLLRDNHVGTPADVGDPSFGFLNGLYWLTVNLADRGPLLLSVDDVHLSDPSSLGFLAYLSRRLEALPVLLVAAGRSPDPEGEDLWRRLAEDPVAEVMRPRALTETGAAVMVRERLGAQTADEFCRACHRATGGNPLFLRELVGALQDAGAEAMTVSASAIHEVGPAAISRFVLHRLERLGPAATDLARAVAILGGDAELVPAAQIAELTVEEARTAADVLSQSEILSVDQRLGFIHPVVQAAVYESLLPGERAARHLAAARLLAESQVAPERVATHLLKAPPSADVRWIHILRAAAAGSAARGDPRTAAAYLRRALEEPLDDPARSEVLCDLGRWETATDNYQAAETHLLAAIETPADPEVHARAAIWLGRWAIAHGGPVDARRALDTQLVQLSAVEGEQALELEAEMLGLVQLHASLRHLVPKRLAEFQRRAAGNARFERMARIHAACEQMVQGGPAAEVADEVESCLAAGPPGDVLAFAMALDALISCERDGAAARWLELAKGAARARGFAPQLAGLYTQSARLALSNGRLGEAELDIQTALEFAGERHMMLPRIVSYALEIAIERGDLAAAENVAQRYGDEMGRERIFGDQFLTSRGRLRLLKGDPRGGLADLLRCGELLGAHAVARPAAWRPEAARALAELGEADRAVQLARDAVAVARGFGAPRTLAHSLRAAGNVIGGAEGLELLEEAVSAVDHSPARLEAAHALAELGAAMVKQRRRREGREVLRLALATAQACGANALADRVRGEIGAGGGRPPRLELSGADALTPAERRVCELALGELSNREIAQQLFVTEKTVELHLTSAYRKLGIRSRFQLSSVLPPAAQAG